MIDVEFRSGRRIRPTADLRAGECEGWRVIVQRGKCRRVPLPDAVLSSALRER